MEYEQFAPKSAEQRQRLAQIEALTDPFRRYKTHKASVAASAAPSSLEDDSTVAAEPTQRVDIAELCELGDLQAGDNSVSSAVARANSHLQELQEILKHTHDLKHCLEDIMNVASSMQERHLNLTTTSGELSQACERLTQEEAMLQAHAAEIGANLKFYDLVDHAASLLNVHFKKSQKHGVHTRGLPKIQVDDEADFKKLLDDIDEAMIYFCGDSQKQQQAAAVGKEAKEYKQRIILLQDAALELIREALVERIKQVSSDVVAVLTSTSGSKKAPIVPAERLEASLIYTKFHGISRRSNIMLMTLQSRLDKSDAYDDLLRLCRKTYCSSREMLLRPSITDHIESLIEQHGIVSMTRLASTFLERVCVNETALYLDFFTTTSSSSSNVSLAISNGDATILDGAKLRDDNLNSREYQGMLGSLCSILHRGIRKCIVKVNDLDTLCQIVNILNEEEGLASSDITQAAGKAVRLVVLDVQERLIFCSQQTLFRDVMKFKPTIDDLDYPSKLYFDEEEPDPVQAQLRIYETWYPPLKTVLRVLSKIFRVVETRVFEDIALQAVQSCTESLKDAAVQIRERRGQIDCDLFLIKHLLVLREQLSPFDIRLRATERQLDFSEAGKAFSQFLANPNRRLFSMNTENALVTLLREGVHVHESSIDSKRDLEDSLRSACNNFIQNGATIAAKPLIFFVEECKSVKASGVADFKNMNFSSVSSVKTIVEQSLSELDSHLDSLLAQLSSYLDGSSTHSILFKPVLRKLSRCIDDFRLLIDELESSKLDEWDSTKANEIRNIVETMNDNLESRALASENGS